MARPLQRMLRHAILPLLLAALAACAAPAQTGPTGPLPDAHDSVAAAPGSGNQVAVLSGGCFWGMQWVFEHVRGVQSVWAGYSGGRAATAHYEAVSTGDTGHAESVKIVYDPKQVSYGQLLKVFFQVAHNPTENGHQGPDYGTQYRSVIFYASAGQRRVAQAYIAQLTRAHAFDAPITTQVRPLDGFYRAEAYHQNYARRHPDAAYIRYNDAPRLAQLKRQLPALYRGD